MFARWEAQDLWVALAVQAVQVVQVQVEDQVAQAQWEVQADPAVLAVRADPAVLAVQVAQAAQVQVECHRVAVFALAVLAAQVPAACLLAAAYALVAPVQTQAQAETQATCSETRYNNRNEERER